MSTELHPNIFELVADHNSASVCQLQRTLRELSQTTTISAVRNDEGFTILHAIVTTESNQQKQMLHLLFRLGFWRQLIDKKVDSASTSPYAGKTAAQIAHDVKLKEVEDTLVLLTEWEQSLTQLSCACRHGNATVVSDILRAMQKECDEDAASKNGDITKGGACKHVPADNDAAQNAINVKVDDAANTSTDATDSNQESNSADSFKRTSRNKLIVLCSSNDDSGYSALHWACVNGNVDVINALLSIGVDPTAPTEDGETLLHIVCMFAHAHLMRQMFQQMKFDACAQDCAKCAALDRVAANGDKQCFDALMACGLGTVTPAEKLASALAAAGRNGQLSFIQHLADKYGIDVLMRDQFGHSALFDAVFAGQLNVVRYLLQRYAVGCGVLGTSYAEQNIIHVAVIGGNFDVLTLVLAELKCKHSFPELINARCKYVGDDLCYLIVQPDVEHQSTSNPIWNPFAGFFRRILGWNDDEEALDESAVMWLCVEVKRTLYGVFRHRMNSPHPVTMWGTVMFSGAGSQPGSADIAAVNQLFNERALAPLAADNIDSTPLHLAAFTNKLDMARVLLDHGADPNIKDKFGLTPLHLSAIVDDVAMARLLVSYGAQKYVRDNQARSAADVAILNGNQDIANLLRDA